MDGRDGGGVGDQDRVFGKRLAQLAGETLGPAVPGLPRAQKVTVFVTIRHRSGETQVEAGAARQPRQHRVDRDGKQCGRDQHDRPAPRPPRDEPRRPASDHNCQQDERGNEKRVLIGYLVAYHP